MIDVTTDVLDYFYKFALNTILPSILRGKESTQTINKLTIFYSECNTYLGLVSKHNPNIFMINSNQSDMLPKIRQLTVMHYNRQRAF